MQPSTKSRLKMLLWTRAAQPAAIAVFCVLIALLWTLLLQPVIAYPFVFLFFGAIIVSAWFGGAIAGTIAVILASLVVNYFLIPPYFSMSVARDSRTFFTAFVICAIAIAAVSTARRRAENAIREARDQLEAKVLERTAELQRSNQEIRESERQLRMLTEAIPQQIWRADSSGRIEYCNQHLRDYLGAAPEDALSDAFFAFLHPEDQPLFRHGWQAALANGKPFEMETRVRSRSGACRWFLVRSIPQRDQAGRIARWYGIHIDMEEQHRAQQNLTTAQNELGRFAQTLQMAEMAASIAHELTQPLTAVVTHACACREWLQSTPANVARASATAEKIVQESTRASQVVRRVRALFRKEAQVREPVEINQLIREMARLLRDEAIRRGISLRLELAPDLPRPEADPVQLQQVLLNLANNAMDAMASVAGPRELVIRSTQQDNGEILIAVEDRGPGIAADLLQQIFQPFFSTRPQGTGMGLAICRSIVEAHDGRLWAANLPQGGAIFQFTVRTHA